MGCRDNSDKVKPFDTEDGCGGKKYSYDGGSESKEVDWQWYACRQNKQCITVENVCDGRPHPACIYQDANGNYMSEDEEFCPG